MTTDFAVAARQEQEFEQARQRNVQTFLRMWLSLGADCIKAVGNSHADEISEALGLAASRWSQLLAMEQQIPNDEARLAILERGRVPDPTDPYVPKDVLDKRDAEHRERVEGARGALKSLKEEAKRGRKELESFTAKAR